jgi:hypothetical protein
VRPSYLHYLIVCVLGCLSLSIIHHTQPRSLPNNEQQHAHGGRGHTFYTGSDGPGVGTTDLKISIHHSEWPQQHHNQEAAAGKDSIFSTNYKSVNHAGLKHKK